MSCHLNLTYDLINTLILKTAFPRQTLSNMTKQLKVAIIDSDDQARYHYKSLINQSLYLDCILAVPSFVKFIQYQKTVKKIDLILFDIKDSMETDYLKKIDKIKKSIPLCKLIVFTKDDDEAVILKYLKSSIDGYLIKDLNRSELEKYLLATMKGGAAISPKIARQLIDKVRHGQKSKLIRDYQFSEKQTYIINSLIEGVPNAKIASLLNISIQGVQYHINKIYKKLEIKNRTELVKLYLINA